MSSPAEPGGPRQGIAGLDLDKVIHERARLRVLTYLASSESAETGFTELRDELGFSSGNLSVQLKTLEEAGYLRIEKRFVENKPFTGVSLTVNGHKALSAYLAELEVIIASLKGGKPKTGKPRAPGTAAEGKQED
jgi:DNA-binding MarR family transcriptional regulator